jgi:hypothetical protein
MSSSFRILRSKRSTARLSLGRNVAKIRFRRGNRHLRMMFLDEVHSVLDGNAVFFASSAGFIVGSHHHASASKLPPLGPVFLLPGPPPFFFALSIARTRRNISSPSVLLYLLKTRKP